MQLAYWSFRDILSVRPVVKRSNMRNSRILVGTLSFVACMLVVLNMLQPQTLRTEREGPAYMRGAPVEGRDLPLIFIGGVPRSGTTLLRAMLDAHPMVRCGQETRVLPRLLQIHHTWYLSEKEKLRLDEAGVTADVIDNAVAAFMLEVIVRHGRLAPRLCNKDPLLLSRGSYVNKIFPNSKFIYMLRDARAAVHSLISRKVTIVGFDNNNYTDSLERWNLATVNMYDECQMMGPDHCLMVYYEKLVLEPRASMKRILKYLDIEWDESVLHHQEHIGKDVIVSALEPSSNQVVRGINRDALMNWYEHFPKEVLAEVSRLAPMLSVLGYDTQSLPPDYNKLEVEVENVVALPEANK